MKIDSESRRHGLNRSSGRLFDSCNWPTVIRIDPDGEIIPVDIKRDVQVARVQSATASDPGNA
jgi:hypothetical protein